MNRSFPVYLLSVLLIGSLIIFMFTGCHEEYAPKPRGYFRIDLPEKHYVKFDTTYPYTFEYPAYAHPSYF
jgi:hypothetical protein